MIALDAVEAQLQAIAWECERLRRDNVPGYLVRQSLEQIEGRVAEIRRALEPALADLYAFHRVADVVSVRMAAAILEGPVVDRVLAAVAARQEQIAAEQASATHLARVTESLNALLFGDGSTAEVFSILPPWCADSPAHPLMLHLRSIGVDSDLAERAALALTSPSP